MIGSVKVVPGLNDITFENNVVKNFVVGTLIKLKLSYFFFINT